MPVSPLNNVWDESFELEVFVSLRRKFPCFSSGGRDWLVGENSLWVTFELVHPKKCTTQSTEKKIFISFSFFFSLSQKVRPSIMQVRKLFL